MRGVNKVILIGNVGKDPETRSTQNGSQIVNFSLATNETWTDRATGEKKSRTEWHRVVIFNEPLGKIAESYLRKGSAVYLEGQLATRKWTDQSGVEKYTTEVVLGQMHSALVLLGDRAEGESDGHAGQSAQRPTPGAGRPHRGASEPRTGPSFGGNRNLEDDEIPF
jgi:single-strand DNA-binding protein